MTSSFKRFYLQELDMTNRLGKVHRRKKRIRCLTCGLTWRLKSAKTLITVVIETDRRIYRVYRCNRCMQHWLDRQVARMTFDVFAQTAASWTPVVMIFAVGDGYWPTHAYASKANPNFRDLEPEVDQAFAGDWGRKSPGRKAT